MEPSLERRSLWPWPESLDALAAAGRHHTRLMENERVRVLEVRIPRGETVPVHTHRWPSVIFQIAWSHFIRRDAQGGVLFDSRSAPVPAVPCAVWVAPLAPHSVENIGDAEIHLLSVELKDG